jgi:hypothetical protein
MGGVHVHELVARNKGRASEWLNQGELGGDWWAFCQEFERVYPDTPEE